MNTVLLTDEPILQGVRCTLVERLQQTSDALHVQPLSDASVHAIRKELKRARASLRLLREALGDNEYQRLNEALRDAARPLTTMRDAKVLLQALGKVVEKTGNASGDAIADELRHALQHELRIERAQLEAGDIAVIRAHLRTVRQGLQQLSDGSFDDADIEAAIKRAHKKARKAFKAARREPSDENLHEWRKQVKYHFNQLELLRPLKARRIDAIIRQARKLSDRLGDDHDLAILHERIVVQSSATNTADAIANAEVMLKKLESMRAKLQNKAYRLGKSLHARKSRKKLKRCL